MNTPDYSETELRVIDILRTVFDPEIPVNIYDIGLIYELRVDEEKKAHITMTLTSPACPIADQILDEVKDKVGKVQNITGVDLRLTFFPPWDPDKLSDEVKLELGLL